MNQSTAHYLLLAAVFTFLGSATAQSHSTPFSAQAEALPFPPENKLKKEKGRVRGTIKMLKPQEAFDEKYLLKATVDAVILTKETQLSREKQFSK